MIQPITKERWLSAQTAERACHGLEFTDGLGHYAQSYANVFRYLGMETDQHGKTIMEIGPADFPALAYCQNYTGIIVEPMPSDHLSLICGTRDIQIVTSPVEEIELPEVEECWIFNLLQHVIDPELLIAKCKEAAEVIRFFEPVDYPTCEYHPHTFSEADFVRWFGDSVKRYKGGSVAGFHGSDCAYGTWRKGTTE